VTLDLHGEALRTADVDVVDREIHAVAGEVSAERFDRREHGGHARLVLDLLEQLLADEKGLDAFLHDLGHAQALVGGRPESILRTVVNPAAPCYWS
jgi:hypothetical protein